MWYYKILKNLFWVYLLIFSLIEVQLILENGLSAVPGFLGMAIILIPFYLIKILAEKQLNKMNNVDS